MPIPHNLETPKLPQTRPSNDIIDRDPFHSVQFRFLKIRLLLLSTKSRDLHQTSRSSPHFPLSLGFHSLFGILSSNFLSADPSPLLALSWRVEKLAIPGFFPRRFSFYFRNFPRIGGRREVWRRRRSIWFIGGRRSLPRAEDCNFEAGGSFSHGFSSNTFALLLLNIPPPLPPPLIAFIAPLSRLTRLRESHS